MQEAFRDHPSCMNALSHFVRVPSLLDSFLPPLSDIFMCFSKSSSSFLHFSLFSLYSHFHTMRIHRHCLSQHTYSCIQECFKDDCDPLLTSQMYSCALSSMWTIFAMGSQRIHAFSLRTHNHTSIPGKSYFASLFDDTYCNYAH